MSGFLALLRKEAVEIRRTWRIWVLPGLLLFFGLTSPIMAELAPRLVESIATDQPGTIIQLPDPVPRDAYRQLMQSLNQIVLIALIIAAADIVSGERRSGTALLVLTKPISRGAFVLAKVIAQSCLVIVAALLAGVVCWIGTRAIFGDAPIGGLAAAVGLWLLLAMVVIAVMTVLSTLLRAQAGAAGMGIAIYAVLILLGQWAPARDYTPAGLFDAIDASISDGSAPVVWPVLTAVVVVACCIALAIRIFERQELAGGAGP